VEQVEHWLAGAEELQLFYAAGIPT